MSRRTKQQPRNRRSPTKGKAKASQKAKSGTMVVSTKAKSPIPTKAVHALCALTDPFCHHAVGSKLPDIVGARTLAYPLHSRSTIVSAANGAGAVLIIPGYNTFLAQTTDVTTTPGVALYGAAGGLGSSITPNAYRIVSFGVKVRNLLAPLNSSGIIRIRGFSQRTGTTLTAISLANYNCTFSEDIPMSGFKEAEVVGMKINETATFFQQPSTTHSTGNVVNWLSPGWGAIQIAVEGTATSEAVLDLEFFIHYELMFNDDDSMNLLTTPSPPVNNTMLQLQSQVSTAAGNVFWRAAESATSKFAKAAVDAIGRALGGTPRTHMISLD